MTKNEIARLEALLEKATPGKWYEGSPSIDGDLTIRSDTPVHAMTNVVCRPTLTKDAALIAAMKNALPALLAAARDGEEDSRLWHWAETNPEKAMGALSMWWATSGRGCREVRFEFRNIIRAAMKESK